MKIYRTSAGISIEHLGKYYVSNLDNWDVFINRDDLYNVIVAELATNSNEVSWKWIISKTILAPIENQEIWAAGVTYLRSMHARVEESKEAGGGSFYDKVYDAERPEIFFKANAQRTVGQNGLVRIRKDSTWDVPEPELTLFITSAGNIVGYTIGNDMSSRSIEGENPLYLPQAKMYEGCAALGPCIYVPQNSIDPETRIEILIERGGGLTFNESITISQMKRQHTELVNFLYKECKFPFGCFLMTGTGIVPPNSFTLQSRDVISITIEHIGTLVNTVA
jgi:2-dehydro-3-deoxy-D-arabinonate dehydratase